MRMEKKCLYIFVLNFFLYSFRLSPLVLLLELLSKNISGLVSVKLFKILKVSVKLPHNLQAHNEGRCNIFNLSSYGKQDISLTSGFVDLCCTFSISSMSPIK